MWERGPAGEVQRRAAPDPGTSEPEQDPVERVRHRRASLGWALRSGFRDVYDYLGAWVLGSLIWASVGIAVGLSAVRVAQVLGQITVIPGLVYLPVLALLAAAIVMGPLMGGLHRYARHAAERHEPEITDFLWGFRSSWVRCAKLGAAQATIWMLLVGDVAFFLAQQQTLYGIIAVVFLYLLAFWSLAAMYQWPLLAHLEDGVGAIIRKSLLLVLDNILFSVVVGVVCLLLSLILVVTAAGALVLLGGVLAMLTTQAARELLRRYEIVGPDPTKDVPPDARTT